MKRLFILVVCVLAAAVNASAQLKFGGGIHVGGAQNNYLLRYDLTEKYVAKRTFDVDAYGVGFTVGAHGTMDILKWLEARLGFDYARFSANTDKITQEMEKVFREAGVNVQPGELSSEGATLSTIDLSVAAVGKIPAGSFIVPYGVAGVSFSFDSSIDTKLKIRNNSEDLSIAKDNSLGLTWGLGVEFLVGKLGLFLEFTDIMNYMNAKSAEHWRFVVGATFGG
jgi:opacity protein-like surface antigen